MNTTNRNIGIRMRHKQYVNARSFAKRKNQTTADFLKSLLFCNVDFSKGLSEKKITIDNAIDELKIAGRIFNIHAKQINANIKNRNHIDNGFFNDLNSIIEAAISAYKIIRFDDNLNLKSQVVFEISEHLKKQNTVNLKQRTWQFFKLVLNEDEYNLIQNKVSQYQKIIPGLTINKFVNLVLGVFQNQNSFESNFTTLTAKCLIRQLKFIRVNANQILNDINKNALGFELEIAKYISDFTKSIIDNLNEDPAVYSGKKFNFMYSHQLPNYLDSLPLLKTG